MQIFLAMRRSDKQISTDWVKHDPYALPYNEQLIYDWIEFSEQVKHLTRYTFFRIKSDHIESGDSAVREPHEVMEHIGQVIDFLEALRIKDQHLIFLPPQMRWRKADRSLNTQKVGESKLNWRGLWLV